MMKSLPVPWYLKKFIWFISGCKSNLFGRDGAQRRRSGSSKAKIPAVPEATEGNQGEARNEASTKVAGEAQGSSEARTMVARGALPRESEERTQAKRWVRTRAEPAARF